MLELLKTISTDYGNLLLFAVALVTVIYTFREYQLKREPAILPELMCAVLPDGIWQFTVALHNLGMTAAVAKVEKAVLRIGDETHPTDINSSFLLSGNAGGRERVVLASVGFISLLGREKIKGREYSINRCEIELVLISKAKGVKRFTHKGSFLYEVDVKGDAPTLNLMKEDLS